MKEKLKKFFSKYKEDFYIILIIVLLISFFCFFGFSKENMDKLFYSYLLTSLIYLLFFRLELFEKLLIQKISIILISGIIYIMYYQTFLGINNKDTLLMVGGIIAFWYGYKRYERDKELETVDKYIMGNLSAKNIEEINKWKIGFLLNEKGYIKKWLWDEIDIGNQRIFLEFLKENLLVKLNKDFSKKLAKIIFPNENFKKYIETFLRERKEEYLKYSENEKIKEDNIEEYKKMYEGLSRLIEIMKEKEMKM